MSDLNHESGLRVSVDDSGTCGARDVEELLSALSSSRLTDPHGRPRMDAALGEHRLRAVGLQLHVRPVSETFHEFIIWLLYRTMGPTWLRFEYAKPVSEQHVVAQWFRVTGDAIRAHAPKDASTVGNLLLPATGATQSLISLAYDVYQLLHCGNICRHTIRRMKARDLFQGARYEVAVAAMLSRCGWKLEYPTRNTPGRRPEFLATHPRFNSKLSVEVKSRHRPGVLHSPGQVASVQLSTADVDRLFRKALEQRAVGMAFLIFIDLNLPPGATPSTFQMWVQPLDSMLARLDTPGPDHPEPYNALFVTNFPFHHQISGSPGSAEHLSIISTFPEHPCPPDLLGEIASAVRNYGYVPEKTPPPWNTAGASGVWPLTR